MFFRNSFFKEISSAARSETDQLYIWSKLYELCVIIYCYEIISISKWENLHLRPVENIYYGAYI